MKTTFLAIYSLLSLSLAVGPVDAFAPVMKVRPDSSSVAGKPASESSSQQRRPATRTAVQAEGDVAYGTIFPGPTFTAVAAGDGVTFAAASDTSLRAFGSNAVLTKVPVSVANVIQISAGKSHVLALTKSGIKGWGSNSEKQLAIPWAVASKTIQISGGGAHSLALLSDGTVRAWGRNVEGQATVPKNLKYVKQIAAGEFHSVALLNSGKVVAWGSNAFNQAKVPAAALAGVRAIAAGGNFTLALLSSGKVVAFGSNKEGQTKIPALALKGVTAVAAGSRHALAIIAGGKVVAWGYNKNGQISVPKGLVGATAIAAGPTQSVALVAGRIKAWGCVGTSNRPCMPPDSCKIANGLCPLHSDCKDIGGTAQCTCKSGYFESWERCIPRDACAVNNGYCDPITQFCYSDDEGKPRCNCKDPNQWLGDFDDCYTPDVCSQSQWGPGACPPKATCWSLSNFKGELASACVCNGTEGYIGSIGNTWGTPRGCYRIIGPRFKRLSASSGGAAAIMTDGTVRVWYASVAADTPSGLKDAVQVSLGGNTDSAFVLALLSNGSVVAWPDSLWTYDDEMGEVEWSPLAPVGLPPLTYAEAGEYGGAGLTENGTFVAWGRKECPNEPVWNGTANLCFPFGRDTVVNKIRVHDSSAMLVSLGNGSLYEYHPSKTTTPSPFIRVPNINGTDVIDMSLSQWHSAVVFNNGSMKIWNVSAVPVLGDMGGPGNVSDALKVPDTGGVKITAVSLSLTETLVLLANGSVRGSGNVPIPDDTWFGVKPAVQIASSWQYGLLPAVLYADGTIYFSSCDLSSTGCMTHDVCAGLKCTVPGTVCSLLEGLAACVCKTGYVNIRGECVLDDPCVTGDVVCSDPKTVCNRVGRGKAECRCRLGYAGQPGACQRGPHGPVKQITAGSYTGGAVMADGTYRIFSDPPTSVKLQSLFLDKNGMLPCEVGVTPANKLWLYGSICDYNVVMPTMTLPSPVVEVAYMPDSILVLMANGKTMILLFDTSESLRPLNLPATLPAAYKNKTISHYASDGEKCLIIVFTDGTGTVYDWGKRALYNATKDNYCTTSLQAVQNIKNIKTIVHGGDPWYWRHWVLDLFKDGGVRAFSESYWLEQTNFPDSLKNIVQIDTTRGESVLLHSNGSVFIYGDDTRRLPVGKTVQIACGQGQIVGLGADGAVWAWDVSGRRQTEVPGW